MGGEGGDLPDGITHNLFPLGFGQSLPIGQTQDVYKRQGDAFALPAYLQI